MDKKRILLVEDEPDLVSIVSFRLETAGYEVIVAADGEEALEKARGENPDLIILDIMIPKINGYTVCRTLKSDNKYKNIPVFMLTARAQVSDIKLGKKVGADAYMTKPFDASVLLSKVEELLKNKVASVDRV